MFALSSRWVLERNLLVIKLMGIARINNIKYIDEQIKSQMLSKILNAISEAEKYEGKVLDVVPTIPSEENSLVVCCSIIFTSETKLAEFQQACPKILYQG